MTARVLEADHGTKRQLKKSTIALVNVIAIIIIIKFVTVQASLGHTTYTIFDLISESTQTAFTEIFET